MSFEFLRSKTPLYSVMRDTRTSRSSWRKFVLFRMFDLKVVKRIRVVTTLEVIMTKYNQPRFRLANGSSDKSMSQSVYLTFCSMQLIVCFKIKDKIIMRYMKHSHTQHSSNQHVREYKWVTEQIERCVPFIGARTRMPNSALSMAIQVYGDSY